MTDKTKYLGQKYKQITIGDCERYNPVFYDLTLKRLKT